jgi:hypothetical protein
MGTIDPALPRIGTDFMTLRILMRTIDPGGALKLVDALSIS